MEYHPPLAKPHSLALRSHPCVALSSNENYDSRKLFRKDAQAYGYDSEE